MDDAAGTAPGSPEVDQHGALGIEDVGFEVGVGYVSQFASHWMVSRVEVRSSILQKV
jgi:hypothetical protein